METLQNKVHEKSQKQRISLKIEHIIESEDKQKIVQNGITMENSCKWQKIQKMKRNRKKLQKMNNIEEITENKIKWKKS